MSTNTTIIPRCDVATNVIRSLGDNPNTDNNLSPDQLKAKFDAAPEAIVQYINNKLIPSLQVKITAEGMLKLSDVNGEVITAVPGVDYQPPLGDKMVTKTMLEEGVQNTLAVADKLVNSASVATLAADKWEEKQQTVVVEGVKAGSHLVVSAAPDSFVVWCESQIRAVSQEEGKVTFKCEDAPAEAVSASILIVG